MKTYYIAVVWQSGVVDRFEYPSTHLNAYRQKLADCKLNLALVKIETGVNGLAWRTKQVRG